MKCASRSCSHQGGFGLLTCPAVLLAALVSSPPDKLPAMCLLVWEASQSRACVLEESKAMEETDRWSGDVLICNSLNDLPIERS